MQTENIEYTHDGTTLEAYIAFDETKGKQPTVLIFHTWRGRDAFVLEKAMWLAEQGYTGCAVDIYGKGVFGSSFEEGADLMKPFLNDRKYLRERMEAALKAIQEHPMIDSQNMAAIGFGFGGLCALDLARSGASIKGVATLHGLLRAPEELKNESIESKVLVIHGHEDPMVPSEEVLDFEKEMTESRVDWQLHTYGQTMHGFTNPASNDRKLGSVYNPIAEQRAFASLQVFLTEVFHQA